MLPREQAVKLLFIFPLHLSNASALLGKTQKHENRIFLLKCCITASPEFNQLLPKFLQFCWLATHIHSSHYYRLPKSCNQLSSDLACCGHSSGEMRLRVLHSSCWTVLHTQCAGVCMHCVAERQMILSFNVFHKLYISCTCLAIFVCLYVFLIHSFMI